ncbi:MAG: hypothetical protein FRX49_07602 [Trebouxia sp. A1-2]|nr:MAG: hypothetical protein FRX49_07602 [Trebouxia sp. A1-2]
MSDGAVAQHTHLYFKRLSASNAQSNARVAATSQPLEKMIQAESICLLKAAGHEEGSAGIPPAAADRHPNRLGVPEPRRMHLSTAKALLLESPLALLPIARLAPLSLVAPTPRGGCKGALLVPQRDSDLHSRGCYLLQQCFSSISAHHVESCYACSALEMSKLGLQLSQEATNSLRSEVQQRFRYVFYDEMFVTTNKWTFQHTRMRSIHREAIKVQQVRLWCGRLGLHFLSSLVVENHARVGLHTVIGYNGLLVDFQALVSVQEWHLEEQLLSRQLPQSGLFTAVLLLLDIRKAGGYEIGKPSRDVPASHLHDEACAQAR